jgi:outer membrane protein assembly factor BamA
MRNIRAAGPGTSAVYRHAARLFAVFFFSSPAWAQLDTGALGPLQGGVVSSITFAGLKHTRPFVVSREIETAVGRPLQLDVLAADLRRLDNLGIFASVAATGQAEGDGVGLTVTVRESIRGVGFPSVSYSEQNGWSYGAGATLLNLLGRNILLSGRALFGGVETYAVKLTDPWFAGNHAGYEIGFASLERSDKLNEFREQSDELAPWVTTHIGRKGRLGGTAGFFQMRADVPGKTLSASNLDRFARFGVQAGYDSRDSWRAPRSGWQGEFEIWRVQGSGDFWSMIVDVRRFQPLGRQKLELSGLLSMQSGTVGEDVPEYFQYRVGGANSIRGYEIDKLGREIFGKNQLLTTAEYVVTLLERRYFNPLGKFPIMLGIEATFFGDAGTAWSDPNAFAIDRFRGGAGAGLRILIPAIDQIRLETGWSPSGGVVFHFAAGVKLEKQRQRIR